METLVPILMMVLFGALALVLYLGRQREEASREEALNRRIQIFVPAPPAADAKAQQDRARARARPGRPMIITWDPLRNLERWLAQAGLEMKPTRFLLVMLAIGSGRDALSALWLDPKMAGLCGAGFGRNSGGIFSVQAQRPAGDLQPAIALHPGFSALGALLRPYSAQGGSNGGRKCS